MIQPNPAESCRILPDEIPAELLPPNCKEGRVIQPEVRLWRAVIKQAARDAMLDPKDREEEIWKFQARTWFRTADNYFRNVVEAAGFDPDELRESMMERMGENG